MKREIFSAVLGILTVSAQACTSWVLRPEVTASGRMIVQKILDSPPSTLDADFRVAPNGWRWIRIGRLNGPSMAMNEKGVAITANCGERNGDEPSRRGRQTLYSFELLWHVVRNCATAEAGVEELKHIGRNRLFRMPGKQLVKYGSILLVADAKRAFLVEIGDVYKSGSGVPADIKSTPSRRIWLADATYTETSYYPTFYARAGFFTATIANNAKTSGSVLTNPHGGRLNILTHSGGVVGAGADDLTNYYGIYVLSQAANSAVVSMQPSCYREFGINEPIPLL